MTDLLSVFVPIQGVDWNNVEDPTDQMIWDTQWTNIWLPEKVSVSGDIPSWGRLTPIQQDATMKVFQGLTLLDTRQYEVGLPSLTRIATSSHELSNYSLAQTMEAVHAKTYSYIFMTMCSTVAIAAVNQWSLQNQYLQRKARMITDAYADPNANKSTIASVFLESFLFYSGFYLPLYWASRGEMTNTIDLIKLIIRDEALHGFYIGYKFQQRFAGMDEDIQEELRTYAYELLLELYDNECSYTESIYDQLGLADDVKRFLRYNANKALMNLGFDPLFPEDECQADQAVLSALEAEITHDFFSGAGSSYRVAVVEDMQDTDYDLIPTLIVPEHTH